MKRKLRGQSDALSADDLKLHFTRKQLRSRQCRSRRLHVSPVVVLPNAGSHILEISEISCDSSIASVSNQKPPVRDEFQRIVTRSYYRKRFKDCSRNRNNAIELSDNSCVESCSGANTKLELKNANVEELEGQGDVTKSEVSSVSRFSFSESNVGKLKENGSLIDVTLNQEDSEIPGVDKKISNGRTYLEVETDSSLNYSAALLYSDEKTIQLRENRVADEQLPVPKLEVDVDLACSEQFSNGGSIVNGGDKKEEEHGSSSSDIFQVISDSELESSEYTPSFWSYASGSQFSEKSIGDESSCPTFELFQHFKQQFCISTFALNASDDLKSCETEVLGMEDEHDEETYRIMRTRERRQAFVHDYAEEYCNSTEFGELVIQQRLHMVHWIVEQSTNKELHMETMFLGVSLLDRFLSKGYFKSMRNLQIAGIACLTLATRIEENQPNNCVRSKIFRVGSTVYGRCEVVAMEWLVLEVLSFQCFLPTSYNFLWFYLKAARANEDVEKTAKYLAVLTLMGHQQLCYWPSTIAAGLVILASIATNQDASCHRVTLIHARLKDTHLPECLKSLEWLVKYL